MPLSHPQKEPLKVSVMVQSIVIKRPCLLWSQRPVKVRQEVLVDNPDFSLDLKYLEYVAKQSDILKQEKKVILLILSCSKIA